MRRVVARLVLVWLAGPALSLAAQQPALSGARGAAALEPAPTFDVVLIKPWVSSGRMAPQTAPPPDPVKPGGVYTGQRTSAYNLLAFAYGIRDPDHTLLNLPDWTKTLVINVDARGPSGQAPSAAVENRAYIQEMMKSLLAQRFHLTAHNETRPLPVYELRAAQSGPKLIAAQATDGGGVSRHHVDGRMGDLTFQAYSMEELAQFLSGNLDRTVLDRTGLSAVYDFPLQWPLPEGRQMIDGHLTDEAAAPLFSGLPGDLGLRLVAATGPLPVLVIDHLEPPAFDH